MLIVYIVDIFNMKTFLQNIQEKSVKALTYTTDSCKKAWAKSNAIFSSEKSTEPDIIRLSASEIIRDLLIHETTATFDVLLEMPDIKAEDIELHLSDNYLVVKGKAYIEDGELTSDEEFEHIISLSKPVDEQLSYAKYEKGVLKVVLPKKHVESMYKIKIDTEDD